MLLFCLSYQSLLQLLDEMRRLASECDGTTNSNSKTVVDAVKHSVKQKANKDESKQKETLRETKLVRVTFCS